MKLVAPTQRHLTQMMSWFNSEHALRSWAGPKFDYPYTQSSFERDLNMTSIDSFALLSDADEFLAFGQCYARIESCHLGRLAVSPDHRGKGVAGILTQLLIDFGVPRFDVKECSLFVMGDNQAAISAYLKLGFQFADYPEKIPIENCLYMVKQTL